MALQVIGAGFGRTGTLSLQAALERLGFDPCHHMLEVPKHPAQIALWNRVADGGTIEWEDIYAPYKASVDWPGAFYFAELAARYPEAKVILTTRDPNSWYDSINETVFKAQAAAGLTQGELPADHPMRFGAIIIVKNTFGYDLSRESAIAAFERHNAEVRRRIPPENLLDYDVAEGWEKLCSFLGVPIPEEPFPRSNSRDDFWANIDAARKAMR
jgi:Sulfotransferase domain